MYVIGFSKDNLIDVNFEMMYYNGKIITKITGFKFGYDKEDIIPSLIENGNHSMVFNVGVEAILKEIKEEYDNLLIFGNSIIDTVFYKDGLIKLNKDDLRIYELRTSLLEVKGD